MSQIHQAYLMEIALGKMAEEKASTSEIRAYADELVQDHTNVYQTVVAMAEKTGAHLQNGAAAHREGRHEIVHEKQLERKLRSANGPDFDRLFLQQTSSDHERLIRKLQQDREDASDDDLEALIDKMTPDPRTAPRTGTNSNEKGAHLARPIETMVEGSDAANLRASGSVCRTSPGARFTAPIGIGETTARAN